MISHPRLKYSVDPNQYGSRRPAVLITRPPESVRSDMLTGCKGALQRYDPMCLGQYDFARIARYARKRFLEGVRTVELMSQACSEQERQEIALVCLLDVEDDVVRNIVTYCHYAEDCDVMDCRQKLKAWIEHDLKHQNP